MYKLVLHKNLNAERWQKFSRQQQLLMIANELNRAANWIKKNDTYEVNNCYERALELLDLTIAMNYRKNRMRELLIAREVLAKLYIDEQKNEKINKLLKKVIIKL
ncbi:MAG: hypothetical protein KGY74_08910 [Candidatus Cloacimonetes bacterium]|nr:hypothetical protein [Candidatus Cloacimonadota bacterium]